MPAPAGPGAPSPGRTAGPAPNGALAWSACS
jgi:hypothetical protein